MHGPFVFFYSTITERFWSDPIARSPYRVLSQYAQERKIDLRFVIGEDSYRDGTFYKSWQFIDDVLIENDTPFQAKVVYYRNRDLVRNKKKRINDDFLESICRDKLKTAELFPDLSKKTALLTSDTDLSVFNSKNVIVKPRYGLCGDDIQVLPIESVSWQDYKHNEYIVQELIESDEGIESLVKQRHELRLYVFNSTLQSAYLRLPKTDSYIANISKGATEKQIDQATIPQSAVELVQLVDKQFQSVQPRLYAIDVMYQDKKPWLVELNDCPGLPDVAVEPLASKYFHALLDLFIQA